MEQQLEPRIKLTQIVNLCRGKHCITEPVFDAVQGELGGEAVHCGRMLLPSDGLRGLGSQIVGIDKKSSSPSCDSLFSQPIRISPLVG